MNVACMLNAVGKEQRNKPKTGDHSLYSMTKK